MHKKSVQNTKMDKKVYKSEQIAVIDPIVFLRNKREGCEKRKGAKIWDLLRSFNFKNCGSIQKKL